MSALASSALVALLSSVATGRTIASLGRYHVLATTIGPNAVFGSALAAVLRAGFAAGAESKLGVGPGLRLGLEFGFGSLRVLSNGVLSETPGTCPFGTLFVVAFGP